MSRGRQNSYDRSASYGYGGEEAYQMQDRYMRENTYQMQPPKRAYTKHDSWERESTYHDEKGVTQIKTITGNEAYTQALIREPPTYFSYAACILYLSSIVGFFCSTANGFDGSLLNSLLEMEEFKSFFNVPDSGLWAGIVTSMYQIGSVVAIPFIGPSIDTWGRKVGMAIGALFIVGGTILQGTTISNHSVGQFMGGRFLLGFGVAIASSAGPMYVVEVSHPAFRGFMTAAYNTFWWIGSIVAAGAARGSDNLKDNQKWLTAIWLQLLFSGLILVLVWVVPESPRWLFANNKTDAAKRMLIYYHGEGDPDSIWVKMQLREYDDALELDGADKRWWDYRALFRDRVARYRLACNVLISVFGQWAGNSVISYFQSAVLNTAGVTNQKQKLNVTLGINTSSFVIALMGAALVDRVGRRPLLLFTNFGCALVWIGIATSTGLYALRGGTNDAKAAVPEAAKPAGTVALVMIYLFGFVYSIGFTPLQALYPVEVLSFEMRAKGMAFSNLSVAAANMINQFAWPISLQRIGWKTYLIFVAWDFFQTIVIYFYIPETKNRTLEELDEIFNAKNPRKHSTTKKKVAMDSYFNVINVEEMI